MPYHKEQEDTKSDRRLITRKELIQNIELRDESGLAPRKNAEEKKTPANTTKKLYELEISEHLFDHRGYRITRVPGGWIYGEAGVFVPWNNEGMNEIKL